TILALSYRVALLRNMVWRWCLQREHWSIARSKNARLSQRERGSEMTPLDFIVAATHGLDSSRDCRTARHHQPDGAQLRRVVRRQSRSFGSFPSPTSSAALVELAVYRRSSGIRVAPPHRSGDNNRLLFLEGEQTAMRTVLSAAFLAQAVTGAG